MLGKIKRPILSVNQKKYTRQILHLIIDLVKIMNECKLQPIFAKRFVLNVTGSEFASDYNKSSIFMNSQRAISQVFLLAS